MTAGETALADIDRESYLDVPEMVVTCHLREIGAKLRTALQGPEGKLEVQGGPGRWAVYTGRDARIEPVEVQG